MDPRALLIDAYGTLLRLDPPAPALRAVLRERFGVEVSEADAAAAFTAEIAYYRLHLGEGRDEDSVAELRSRCAGVLGRALPASAALRAVTSEELATALLDSLRFRVFDDALPALAAVRRRGVRIVVVSNWDVSLPATLAALGVLDAVDGVVTSAACAAAKPDPAVFTAALRLAGVEPPEAIHIGDSLEEDVAGARAAGIEPLLLVRGSAPAPAGVRWLRSLVELPRLLDRASEAVRG